jgi:hypothetical protein
MWLNGAANLQLHLTALRYVAPHTQLMSPHPQLENNYHHNKISPLTTAASSFPRVTGAHKSLVPPLLQLQYSSSGHQLAHVLAAEL